jgi:hypothetical protein
VREAVGRWPWAARADHACGHGGEDAAAGRVYDCRGE